jgi:hypothetical protein
MASCATERGWPSGADGFVKRLTETLSREAWALDEAVHKYGIVDYRQGRSAYRLTDPPPSAIELERSILERIRPHWGAPLPTPAHAHDQP